MFANLEWTAMPEHGGWRGWTAQTPIAGYVILCGSPDVCVSAAGFRVEIRERVRTQNWVAGSLAQAKEYCATHHRRACHSLLV